MARREVGAPKARQLQLFSAESRKGIKVLAHPDLFVLEQELLDRVEAARSDDLQPLLVLVPTRVLAQHLRRRLTERRRAWLGVEVIPFRGLVHRILKTEALPPLRALSKRLLEALLGRVQESVPENQLVRFLRKRPGSLRSLLNTLNDLREAGIPAAATRQVASTQAERALAEIYEAYAGALEKLIPRGMTDEAGLVAAAVASAEGHARRYRAVFLYGAYELVGMHLDLVRAVSRGSEVTALLPIQPGSPASAYGDRFARSHLLDPGVQLVSIEKGRSTSGKRVTGTGALLGDRLAALHDEEAALDPLDDETVKFRHTQGPAAEISVALRHALRAVEQGVPPTEIALVARSLTPYAAALQDNLGEPNQEPSDADEVGRGRLPCMTSLAYPLRREPVIHDLLVLLRVLAQDFPRAATAELLRSPRVRWRALLPDQPPPRGDLAELWSRRAGILGGIREWTEDLPNWACKAGNHREEQTEEQRAESGRRAEWRTREAERIAAALSELENRFEPAPARWGGHAENLEQLTREVLPGTKSGLASRALQAFLGLLEEMRDLSRLARPASEVPFESMLDWLERAVDETEILHQEEDGGGIRLLDAMQARGLTFRRVFFIGFHSNLFPRVPRQDPFLSDDFRRRLRESTSRPLPIQLEGEQEEHLLLSMILGSAGERLDVSWQRADDTGRSSSPSLALRELARLVYGAPELEHVFRKAERISSHPAQRLRELACSPGLLTPSEEDLLIALRSPNPESAMASMVKRKPDLEPGLAMVCATESFAPRELRYDGRAGDFAPQPQTFAVTALQRLGRCPLQYFFDKVLKVRELQEEATVYDIPLMEMGDRVHRVLESLYRSLLDEGLFETGDGERLVSRALERLDSIWNAHMEDLEGRRLRRLSLLWTLRTDSWKESLRQFLTRDLRRITWERWTPVELEKPEVRTIQFGHGVDAEVSARFDRTLVREDETVIGDYKTSGRLGRQVNVTEMLKGKFIQVPLYHMLAGEQVRVEVLGVGRLYDLDSDDPDDRSVADFDGFHDKKKLCREGFRETMRSLLSLARAGSFPMIPGESCRYCNYVLACRKNHPPSLEREAHARDASDLRDIQRKAQSQPTLVRVRAASRGPDSPPAPAGADENLHSLLDKTLQQGLRQSKDR